MDNGSRTVSISRCHSRTTYLCPQLITPTSVSESTADQDSLCVREHSGPEPHELTATLTVCSAAVFVVAEKQVTACLLSVVFGNTLLSLPSCGMPKLWATGKTSWLTNLLLSVLVQGTLVSVKHECYYVAVMLQFTVQVASVGNIKQVHSLSTGVFEVWRQCFNGFPHVRYSGIFQVELPEVSQAYSHSKIMADYLLCWKPLTLSLLPSALSWVLTAMLSHSPGRWSNRTQEFPQSQGI